MSIVLIGSTSGSCTLQEQAVAGTTTLTLPTFNGTVGLLVSGTAVASTSGTSIDFTGIPAGVRRITVMFNGVSKSGTADLLIQSGSGSIENTGYVSVATTTADITSTAGASSTAGYRLSASTTGATTYQGFVTLVNVSSNIWVESGVLASGGVATFQSGGSKSFSGVIDRIRITTTNGTDTFDAGSINILYE
jgi:hypothetical protein